MPDIFDQLHASTAPASGGDVFDAIHAQAAPPAPVPQNAPGAVKPGMSDDDIIRSLGYDPKIIKQSGSYQSDTKGGGLQRVLSDPNSKSPLDHIERVVLNSKFGDAAMGGADTLFGIAQILNHTVHGLGMNSDADSQYSDMLMKLYQQDYLQNIRQGKPSSVARLAGQMMVPLPGVGEAAPGASLLARGGRAALNGAIAAGTQPVDTSNGKSFATQKGEQMATGAVVAPAVGGAASMVAKPIVKAINAAQGNIAPETKALMDTAAQHGVPLTLGDITRNPAIQKSEVLTENVPVVGLSGVRAQQQQAARSTVEGAAAKLRDQFENTPSQGLSDVQQAAAGGDARAKAVLDKLNAAGKNPDDNLQASIALQDWRTRQKASDLYGKVDQLVQQNNLGNVPMTATSQALDAAIKQAEASKIPSSSEASLLRTIKANITQQPPPAATPSGILDASGSPIMNQAAAAPVDNSYGNVRQLRSDLGNSISDYFTGKNQLIGKSGVGYLQQVKNGIDQDLSDFAQKSGVPAVQQASKAADQYYRSTRVPFLDSKIANAAVTTEPDQIFNTFVKQGAGDRAQKFYDALDPKGQASVKYGIVADALNKATDNTKDIFSPQKFATAMEKAKDAYGVFFKGTDKAEMDGITNLMAHVTRAGQFAENPPTGQRVIPMMMAMFHAAPAVPLAASMAMLKPVLMSDAAKKYLVAASQVKPGSPMMNDLLSRIKTAVQTSSARAATMPSQNGVAQ